jgi:hypothetical protein
MYYLQNVFGEYHTAQTLKAGANIVFTNKSISVSRGSEIQSSKTLGLKFECINHGYLSEPVCSIDDRK